VSWELGCSALLLLALATTQAAETEMLTNGEMEAPFVNGLAQGWAPNCYGSNEVVFAQESADVHGGKSAQRVTCARFDDGGVQFHSGEIAVQKGKPYTLRLWMKGNVAAPVYVGIRKHGSPYTPYLKRDIRVRKDWTPCLIVGQASDSDARYGIHIMFAGTGLRSICSDAAAAPSQSPGTPARGLCQCHQRSRCSI
jgi:hypothetical protein